MIKCFSMLFNELPLIYGVEVEASALSCFLIAEILGKDTSRGRASSCHSRDQGPTQTLWAGALADPYSLWIYHFIST